MKAFLGFGPCLTLCLVVLPTAASAQEATAPAAVAQKSETDEEARGLFQAGRAAYGRGRFGDALRYFQQAYELSDRPRMLYNIGQAADKLRQDKVALDAFQLYLERMPDAHNREMLEQRIATLAEVVETQEAIAAQEVARAAGLPDPEPATEPQVDNAAMTADLDADDGALTGQWWFWGAAGGAVAAIVVGVVLASSGGGGANNPTKGDDGLIIAVLSLE